MARNPLKLVSCIVIFSSVPRRTSGLEFTSWTAASMATFATFPIMDLKEKIDPMFTTSGLLETFVLAPLEKCPSYKTISKTRVRRTSRRRSCIELVQSSDRLPLSPTLALVFRPSTPSIAPIRVSWMSRNPGKRFFGFRRYSNNGCNFFDWVNKEKNVQEEMKEIYYQIRHIAVQKEDWRAVAEEFKDSNNRLLKGIERESEKR
ncbi:hypothetical protein LguiA_005584 [Lonicera macranthoides]